MKPVQNEKWLHISEEIVPLTRDEAGMLKGGFTEVDLPEDIMPFALSNSGCKNPRNCSNTTNSDICSNTGNCGCSCWDGNNKGCYVNGISCGN